MHITRRAFIAGLAATTSAAARSSEAAAQAAPIPIIDTHIHLFDPNRPQGAPYSGPRTPGVAPVASYPDGYRTLAVPLGIVGAVKVEASPWIEDNLWALQVAERDPIMVGVIGNLEPNKPEFPEYLERYRKNPLFRGIRYGNLWNRDFTAMSTNQAFLDGLKLVAQADLVMDTANPRIALFEAIIRISDAVPNLRIVLDHVPGFEPSPQEMPAYEATLKEIGTRPKIYVKISQIAHRIDGKPVTDLAALSGRVDMLIGIFGEDRIVFGTDYPNSNGVAPIDTIVGVAKGYFSKRPRALQEKYYWKNSIAAYRWVKREAAQPSL